jgi:HEPN domain
MPVPNPAIAVVRDWIVKAENDLRNPAHTLKLGADCPTDTVCFHAQQCAEKYIKALLVFGATPFPKTHNIQVMSALSAIIPTGDNSPKRKADRGKPLQLPALGIESSFSRRAQPVIDNKTG